MSDFALFTTALLAVTAGVLLGWAWVAVARAHDALRSIGDITDGHFDEQ